MFICKFITVFLVFVDDGKIYSFGDGSNGQLGHGTIQLNYDAPQQIVALKKHKIKWASCGENHTAAISGMKYF